MQKILNRYSTHSNTLFISIVLIPVILFFGVFYYYPFVKNIILMFYEYDYIHEPVFIGLANIKTFFNDELAFRALMNTFIITLISVPLVTALALFIAMGVYQLKYFQTTMRSAIFCTHLTSIIIAAIIFKLWFGYDLGFINGVLSSIGLEKIPWLTETAWAMLAVIIVSVWKYFGYFMVIFLAGLSNIDGQLYEAAKVDGAGAVKQFINITLPMLKPTLVFSMLISSINYLRSYALVEVLTKGGPYRTTETILMYMFDKGFEARRVGYASVIAFVVFLVIFTVSILQLKLTKTYGEDE